MALFGARGRPLESAHRAAIGLWTNDGHPPRPGVAFSSATQAIEGAMMQIEIKARNVPVDDELREHVERRLNKVARQVSDLARLEIEIFKEPNPRVAACPVAEAPPYLK